jgi:DNA polymerase III delta prime subunit
MSQAISQLFTEIFRPQSLEQAILVPRVREELAKGVTTNTLLVGSAGIGKTTATKILTKGFHDVLEINASAERGVDVIRDSIINFASSLSLLGGKQQLKIVVLEECDGLTNDAWMAMRATMEKFHSGVRFIGNCNYPEKIPAPILSRFNVIHLGPINKEEEEYLIEEYKKRIKLILDKIQIQYTEETLSDFVKLDFPDMRTLLNKVQSLYNRGEKVLDKNSLSGNFDYESLFRMCTSQTDPVENYKVVVSEWSTKVDDCVLAFGKEFPDYLRLNYPDKTNKLPLIIIAIAEYASQLNNVPDKVVTLLALIYKIQIILNS